MRNGWEGFARLFDFFAIVAPHADRWDEFRYIHGGVNTIDYAIDSLHLQQMSLPSLTTLVLKRYNPIDSDSVVLTCLRQWTLPALRHFDGLDVLPWNSWCTNLVTCSINSRPSNPNQLLPVGLSHILSALQQMPRLETLSLELDHRSLTIRRIQYPVAILNMINVLDIRISGPDSVEGVMKLFHSLCAPNLSKLTIDITLPDATFFPDWNHVLETGNNDPQVQPRDLKLIVHRRVDPDIDIANTDIVALRILRMISHRRLEHLSFSDSYLRFDEQLQESVLSILPSLRSLRFTGCESLMVRNISIFLQRAMSDEVNWNMDKFDELEINDCLEVNLNPECVGWFRTQLGDKFLFIG